LALNNCKTLKKANFVFLNFLRSSNRCTKYQTENLKLILIPLPVSLTLVVAVDLVAIVGVRMTRGFKLFMTSMLMLSPRCPLGFDTTIVEIMGRDLKMSDELCTRRATIKDVLAHRLGLPSYQMISMMGLNLSPSLQQYCRSAGMPARRRSV